MTERESAVEAIYRLAGGGRSAHKVVTPTPAVAAVLCRHTPAGEFQVYLAQRADTMRFVPSLWTFPGGAIDAEDRTSGPDVTSDPHRAHRAAAIREVREETGLDLTPYVDRFIDIGNLVTPPEIGIRFDALLFLVELGNHEVVDHRASGGELQDGQWVTPDQAIDHWKSLHWFIPTPTVALLETLRAGWSGAGERCRQTTQELNRSVRAYPVVPGIWISPVRTPTLPPATTTNVYTIGGDELIMIDPASPYAPEQEGLDTAIDALAAQGHRLVEIWLTHHHADHVGGAAHLSKRLGIPVAAHRKTAELVSHRVQISRFLEDGDVVELPGDPPRRLRVVFTPGHAPGHICVLEEHTRIVVAGDMVAGIGTIVIEPSEGDMSLYLESLRRLKALDPRGLLPAHGPVLPNAQAKLDHYIEHRLWREARVLEALRDRGPASSRELVPGAYADVPPMVYPLAERSLIAHLIKLERDGLATRTDDIWSAVV